MLPAQLPAPPPTPQAASQHASAQPSTLGCSLSHESSPVGKAALFPHRQKNPLMHPPSCFLQPTAQIWPPVRDPAQFRLGKAAAAFQKLARKGSTMAGKGAGRAFRQAHLLPRTTPNPSSSMAVTPRGVPSPPLALGQGGGLCSSGKCCNRILPLCRKTSPGNIPIRQQAEMAPPGKVKTQRSSDFWGRKYHSRQRPMGLGPAPRTSHQPQIFPSEVGHWQPWFCLFVFFFLTTLSPF